MRASVPHHSWSKLRSQVDIEADKLLDAHITGAQSTHTARVELDPKLATNAQTMTVVAIDLGRVERMQRESVSLVSRL